MRSLFKILTLLCVILSLSKEGDAQYVQPMGYKDYSFWDQVNMGNNGTKLTHPSAYLELGKPSGSTRGFLLPRGSKDAISSPAEGLHFYDIATHKPWYYNGTTWVDFTGGGGTAANNYLTSVGYASNVLTFGRSGLTDLTVTLPFSSKLNITDTIGKWVGSVYARGDSIFYKRGSTEYFVYSDAAAGGSWVPVARELTIDGVTHDLDSNQSWGPFLNPADTQWLHDKVISLQTTTDNTVYSSPLYKIGDMVGVHYESSFWNANRVQSYYVDATTPHNGSFMGFDSTLGIIRWMRPDSVAGGSGVWGSITGTLSAQTDLQTALNAKVTGNSAITGATKTKITYDSKGLVTAGADATTTDIAEGSNLYFTNSRARTAISLTTTGSGAATYDNTTGALNIPNTTYTLPTATTSVLGGVKVDGTTISISGGVISATGGGGIDDVLAVGQALTSNRTLTTGTNTFTGTSTFQDGATNSAFTFNNTLNTSSLTVGLKATVTGTNPSSIAVLGSGSGVTQGVSGQSSSGVGTTGQSTSGTGLYGKSTSGNALLAETNTGIAIIGTNFSSSGTNGVTTMLKLSRDKSGSAANGIGGSIEYTAKTSDGFGYTSNTISSIFTNVTTASRTSSLIFSGANNGSNVDIMTLGGEGYLKINGITATAASAITPSAGMVVFVNSTDATFTSVGFWGYDGTSWSKF